MEVKKISSMLESFYTILWEYIVVDMQIEASKLQVLKDYLHWASLKCFTWVLIISITAFCNPLVVLLLHSRNYIWITTAWMDQSTSKVKLLLINLQMKIRRVFHAYWERNIFYFPPISIIEIYTTKFHIFFLVSSFKCLFIEL